MTFFDDADVNPLGFEEITYPQVYAGRVVTVCHGWFFPDLDDDEPAWYLETTIDKDGKTATILNTFGIYFDFETPLLDYLWPPGSTHTMRELIEMGIEVPE